MSRRKPWGDPLPTLADAGRPVDEEYPIPDHLAEHAQHCDEPTCPTPIVFAITKNNARAPVDAHPTTKGNLRVFWHNNALRTEAVHVNDRVEGEPLHQSHFSTCTNPGRFRKQPQTHTPRP